MEGGPGVKRGNVRRPSGAASRGTVHPLLVTLVSIGKGVDVGVVEQGLVPVTPREALRSRKSETTSLQQRKTSRRKKPELES